MSDRVCDVAAADDPVAAALAALERGHRLALPTSGSTGAPRVIIRSAASWLTSFPKVSALLDLDGAARVWVPGPLTATMNLFGAVHAVHTGAALVHSPASATHAHLTPAALARTLPDLAGVHVLVAGDRLSRPLHDRAVAAGARVSHYYGAAELSFVAWGTHEANLQPFPEVEVQARDGVLWVRSPYLCDGYDDPPDRSGRTPGRSGPLRRDADGFATVEDRGALVDGYVRVSGRGAEAVTTGGATVLVADVEAELRPAAGGDLVVLGVPHPDLGEVVVAVLTDPGQLGAARVHARTVLPPASRPRRWFAVPELPLTPAGKVDRAALRDRLVSPDEGVRRLS